MRLAEQIARWLGRVEVALSGAEDALREGEWALGAGDFMRARAAAHRILERVPGSPLGLALLSDACELGGLDAELAMTLEELALRIPSRDDVWLRLGHARARTGGDRAEVRDAYVQGLGVAEAGTDTRRDLLLSLTDLDLQEGDGPRADLWLDRLADDRSESVALRRAEARLLRNDVAGAGAWLRGVEGSPSDGRLALARGRTLLLRGEAAAFAPLLRAVVLDTPGASELLSSALAWVPTDEETRGRIAAVVEARGEASLARWRAAFARARGQREEALAALTEAVAAGETSAARPLLDAALEDRSPAALRAALESPALVSMGGDPLLDDCLRLASALAFLDGGGSGAEVAFHAASAVTSTRVAPWASDLLGQLARLWVPLGSPASWDELLALLDGHARTLGDLPSAFRLGALAAERSRPVRLAVVGEFNAGKSTFINALVGADVAPTGVLPTTATLHHLRYAPDPFARITFEAGTEPPERLVPTADLRATLKALGDSDSADGSRTPGPRVDRVDIHLPLPFLTRLEILDTPGFNALDPRHAAAARKALEEADVLVWLLDAAQPLKQSERVLLEEVSTTGGPPVQILVNKTDRLGEEDLAKVMAAVGESLAEAHLRSWTPPLALSARLALRGKLEGNGEILVASRWPAVQALLDEAFVGRSHDLKERALRRRGLAVAEALVARARAAQGKEEDARIAAIARANASGQAAAQLDGNADEATRRVAADLEPILRRLGTEMAQVVIGRDEASARRDASLVRYRADRAVALVAPLLAGSLASLVPAVPGAPDAHGLLTTARGLTRAAVLAAGPGDPPNALAHHLARAAVEALVEQLSALALPTLPPEAAGGATRELQALAAALASGGASP